MEQRIEFGLRALEGGNFRARCREYGITARTGYKWRERLVLWGTKGLREESRRPHKSPGALGERPVCEMVRLKKRHPCTGTAQDPAIVSAAVWRGCEREQFQAGAGASRHDRAAGAATGRGPGRSAA